MSKKIISVLLALVMVLAMGTVALVSVSADLATLPEVAEGCNRYFFYMPPQWYNDYAETAGIYWWENTGACDSWPGYEANKADFDGVYYYDVPADVTTIIWNNYLDGGMDKSLAIYSAAVQTGNVGSEYYEPDENENIPGGTDSFDGMIYVTDFNQTDVNPYSGKITYFGQWCYYYGDGKYGFTPEEGAGEVFTAPAFNWSEDAEIATDAPSEDELPTEAPTTVEPTEAPTTAEPTQAPTTVEPTEAPTAAPTAAPVVETGKVIVGEKPYGVTVGDVITYTYKLTTPSNIENVQATTYYDAEKLELIPNDGAASFNARVMFPVLRDMSSVIFNTDIPGEVKFNSTEGVDAGFDFTAGDVLVTLQFKVLDNSADSTISTTIEEMVKFGEKVDYATGGQIVADGVTFEETLTGNTEPPVVEPTVAPTEEPTEAPTAAPTQEPTEAPTVAPTQAPTQKPTQAPATQAPTKAPVQDPTSVTDAPATQAPTNAPNTGAAAYIYVVVAVLAMAACAVVVLRKRVNG